MVFLQISSKNFKFWILMATITVLPLLRANCEIASLFSGSENLGNKSEENKKILDSASLINRAASIVGNVRSQTSLFSLNDNPSSIFNKSNDVLHKIPYLNRDKLLLPSFTNPFDNKLFSPLVFDPRLKKLLNFNKLLQDNFGLLNNGANNLFIKSSLKPDSLNNITVPEFFISNRLSLGDENELSMNSLKIYIADGWCTYIYDTVSEESTFARKLSSFSDLLKSNKLKVPKTSKNISNEFISTIPTLRSTQAKSNNHYTTLIIQSPPSYLFLVNTIFFKDSDGNLIENFPVGSSFVSGIEANITSFKSDFVNYLESKNKLSDQTIQLDENSIYIIESQENPVKPETGDGFSPEPIKCSIYRVDK